MAILKPEHFFAELSNGAQDIYGALQRQTSSCGYPVYASIDIRDAGWKVCAVDVNLFPAGFNNLTPGDQARGAKVMREFFSAKLLVPAPWTITVVPEGHTNNQGYLRNLAGILRLLENAGCKPKLLWPGPPIPKPWTLKTADGDELTYLPAAEALEGSQALLLNHDLSGGIPAAIQNVQLPTFPSTKLGWFRRRKSTHQDIVESLLKKIESQVDGFDPWYLSARTKMVDHVDFSQESSVEHIATAMDEMLRQLTEDYKQRSIDFHPRIFVKNDSGTYGMGILSLRSGADLLEASRNMRKQMTKGKDSVPITQVIVQETVPSALVYQGTDGPIVGEPVLYLINGTPIGGFMRIHEKLGVDAAVENMNRPGAIFEGIDCAHPASASHRPFPQLRGITPCQSFEQRQIYHVIARLHATAAGLEECPGL